MKYLTLHFFVPILVLITSCCASKTSKNTEAETNITTPLKDEILFINLKMEAKSAKEKSISLINYIKTAGKIKSQPESFKPQPKGTYLTISFFDSQNKNVYELNVEHPLMRDVESFEENGKIQQNSVNVPSAEFSVRIQNTFDARYIKVKEVVEGKPNDEIFTIKLESK
jgi:hypothetical protein